MAAFDFNFQKQSWSTLVNDIKSVLNKIVFIFLTKKHSLGWTFAL